ncbi:hypothetical protein Fmac_012492 [Flemingia macrophylla]|uniref:Uncharacterized protein n=1 Tax=Flemingia macrophylla TaxID=520843 RepID=A0ABD1MQG0_9FABA
MKNWAIISHRQGNISDPQLIDIFSFNSEQGKHNELVTDLMAGLSMDENPSLQSES